MPHPFLISLRNIFHRGRVEQDLDDEVRSHLDLLTEENLRSEMSREKALLRARREPGGEAALQDKIRDVRIGVSVDDFLRDLRYAARTLIRNPAFTTVVVFTLSLGIGANTAVFSIFNVVLLRPLPFRDAQRLIAIWESDPKRLETTGIWNSYRDLDSWKRESKTVEDLAGYTWVDAQPVLRGNGTPRRVFAHP